MARKMEAKGGKGGNQWDDGADHENVAKIHVRGGREGVQFIKIEYVKAGKTIVGPINGVSGKGFTQTFEIDHLKEEHLVAVKGWYDNKSGVIQALQFETNQRSSEVMGYDENGTNNFTLEVVGNKITGFHGSADANLKSLGVYLTPLPPVKLEIKGGTGGNPWDHGIYTGVRKLYVTFSPPGICHIKVDYDKDGKVETRENGGPFGENGVRGQQYEFVLDYPNEYVTSIEGTCDPVSGPTNRIRSLSFKTSKDRTSPTYGKRGGQTFVFESKGKALIGLYGRSGFAIDAIGAYFGPPPIPSLPVEKLQGKGGTGGSPWDHGVYTGVRKLYVTISPSGISHIKVDYDKDGKVETHQNGDTLGENRVPGQQYEFVLDYPNEYVTSIEGTCDTVSGHTNRIRSLSFKTSKDRKSPTYGTKGSQTFVFESKGRALVGFYGRSGWAIDAIGAYFGPPPFP